MTTDCKAGASATWLESTDVHTFGLRLPTRNLEQGCSARVVATSIRNSTLHRSYARHATLTLATDERKRIFHKCISQVHWSVYACDVRKRLYIKKDAGCAEFRWLKQGALAQHFFQQWAPPWLPTHRRERASCESSGSHLLGRNLTVPRVGLIWACTACPSFTYHSGGTSCHT